MVARARYVPERTGFAATGYVGRNASKVSQVTSYQTIVELPETARAASHPRRARAGAAWQKEALGMRPSRIVVGEDQSAASFRPPSTDGEGRGMGIIRKSLQLVLGEGSNQPSCNACPRSSRSALCSTSCPPAMRNQ